MKAIQHFTADDRERIRGAVKEAESLTSGEIRVYIEDKCKGEVMDRAAFIFGELMMHKTDERNGVLIYLAIDDKKFAIIGDAGIHAKTGDHFWDAIKTNMADHFRQSQFTQGLITAIKESGEALQKFFPHQPDDRNELSDEIQFG